MQTQLSSVWTSFPQTWSDGTAATASTSSATRSATADLGGATAHTASTLWGAEHDSRISAALSRVLDDRVTVADESFSLYSVGALTGTETGHFLDHTTTYRTSTYGDTSSAVTAGYSSSSLTADSAGTTSTVTGSSGSTASTFTGTRTATATTTTAGTDGEKIDTTTEAATNTLTNISTVSTSTQTGAAVTDTTSTFTFDKSHTYSTAETQTTTTGSTDSYTYTLSTTTGSTASTVTTTSHAFALAADTLLLRDFSPVIQDGLWNSERIWTTRTAAYATTAALSAQTLVGGFTDFFASISDSVATGTLTHPNQWTTNSTVIRTFAYSSSGTSESLNGVAWDSTEAASSSTVTFHTDLTQTSSSDMASGYSTDGAWTTSSSSISLVGAQTGFSQTWNTWHHSSARTDTTTVSTSTAETIEYEVRTTDTLNSSTRSVGLWTTTSAALSETTTTYAWTAWSGGTATRTVARMSVTSDVTGASFTRGTLSTSENSYDLTLQSATAVGKSFEALDAYGLTIDPHVRARCLANGFFGFGGGWDTSDAVHNAITATLISGSHFAPITMRTDWPAAGIFPNASAWRTDGCATTATDFALLPSAQNIAWSRTDDPATSASLMVTWTSTTTTGTATSDTAITTTDATYGVSATDTITGSICWTHGVTQSQAAALAILQRPGTASPFAISRLTFGGLTPLTGEAQTLLLPPGSFSYTQGDATGGTTATSTTATTSPAAFTFAGSVSVTGWFEKGFLRRLVTDNPDAGWRTGFVYYQPEGVTD